MQQQQAKQQKIIQQQTQRSKQGPPVSGRSGRF